MQTTELARAHRETAVVGYDGSAASRRALAHAASLVRRRGPVVVVNVVPAQSVSSRLQTVSEAQRIRQEQLLREAEIFLSDRGIEVETVGAAGDPLTEILSVADEVGARYLVVGRGEKAKHLLRRSVSVRLARAAKCDVLVVR